MEVLTDAPSHREMEQVKHFANLPQCGGEIHHEVQKLHRGLLDAGGGGLLH